MCYEKNEMNEFCPENIQYRFAVIDDSAEDAQQMKGLLSECFPSSTVDIFNDTKTFVAEKRHYSMTVLDVHLEKENGLHTTKEIQRYTSCIIFSTAYPTELVSAISYKVIGFLRKTDSRQILKDKLLEAEKEYLSDFVIVETPIGSFSVNRHMVSLISMENRKLYLYLDQGQKMQTLNLRLRDVPEVLGSSFVQINKSEYVNTEHIRVFDQNKLVLINGIEVFVSRRKEKEVQNAYFRRFL